MYIDYHPRYVKRDDNGFITEACIRFFEGDYQIVTKMNPLTKTTYQESQYVRSKRLTATQFKALKNLKLSLDGAGYPCFIFLPNHFGNIKTDTELDTYLRALLKLATAWTPIPDQA